MKYNIMKCYRYDVREAQGENPPKQMKKLGFDILASYPSTIGDCWFFVVSNDINRVPSYLTEVDTCPYEPSWALVDTLLQNIEKLKDKKLQEEYNNLQTKYYNLSNCVADAACIMEKMKHCLPIIPSVLYPEFIPGIGRKVNAAEVVRWYYEMEQIENKFLKKYGLI